MIRSSAFSLGKPTEIPQCTESTARLIEAAVKWSGLTGLLSPKKLRRKVGIASGIPVAIVTGAVPKTEGSSTLVAVTV